MDKTAGEDAWNRFVRDLGHNIASRRAELDLSQEDVAYRAGISRYAYQKLERGAGRPGRGGNPSLRQVLLVADALQVALTALLPERHEHE